MDAKACTKCHEVKPFAAFGIKSSSRDGMASGCKERERERHAKYRKNNPDKKRLTSSRWRANNLERKRKYDDAWKVANPDKVKAVKNRQDRKRLSTARGRLEHYISTGVRDSIARGSKCGRTTFDLLGYSADELHGHLEKLFQPGMTWDNYGEWHVDHIIPKAAFNYQTPDDIDFNRCWALSNLQPLWARDNLSKGDKLFAPFQPSLALAA